MNALQCRRYPLALALALAVSACGGGGGSDAPAAAPSIAAPSPTEPGAPALTNNVPADGLAWINFRRGQLGVPVLTRNSLIDRAAQGHSDYQKTNNTVSHEQIAGKPGFTGVKTADRVRSAGYQFGSNGYVGEVISATSNSSGFYMAEELITAIYHRFAIFEPKFSEIGTGSATTSANYTYFTSNFATPNAASGGIGASHLVVWPASGQTMVPPNFFSDNETPDPIPNANEVGYPVSVHANFTSTLQVTSFTMRQRGSNSDVAVKLLSQANDIHTGGSVASIIPLTTLRGGTVYDVTFRGTVNGIAADRTWWFTTR